MASLVCCFVPRVHEEDDCPDVSKVQLDPKTASTPDTKFLHTESPSPKGCIRAVQSLDLEAAEAVDVQTSWISVANVSFADMLCSVDKARDSPRNACCARASSRVSTLTPAGPSEQGQEEVNFPRLSGRISDSGEKERPSACIWEHRGLPTVREQGSPARSCSNRSSSQGARQDSQSVGGGPAAVQVVRTAVDLSHSRFHSSPQRPKKVARSSLGHEHTLPSKGYRAADRAPAHTTPSQRPRMSGTLMRMHHNLEERAKLAQLPSYR